jgi:LysM repeat protein
VGSDPSFLAVKAAAKKETSEAKGAKPEADRLPDYEVKPGDTIYQIARKMGLEPREILHANHGIKGLIRPGQHIRPPRRMSTEQRSAWLRETGKQSSRQSPAQAHGVIRTPLGDYVAGRGDTVEDIANHVGVTRAAVLKANPGIRGSGDTIRPGRRIHPPRQMTEEQRKAWIGMTIPLPVRNPHRASAGPIEVPPVGPLRVEAQSPASSRHAVELGLYSWFAHHSRGSEVAQALVGKSALGTLDEERQRILLDFALEYWRSKSPGNMHELSGAVARDPVAPRELVAQRFAHAAGVAAMDGGRDERYAEALAKHAIILSGGASFSGPPSQRLPPEKMDEGAVARLVKALPPDEATGFAEALTGPNMADPWMLTRILTALNKGDNTSSAQAFVARAFANTRDADYAFTRDLPNEMAKGLARTWHHDDSLMQWAEGLRFSGILGTAQGRELLAKGDALHILPESLRFAARAEALSVLRHNPQITAEVLRGSASGWSNKELNLAIAQSHMDRYAELFGSEPSEWKGAQLENLIGLATNLMPEIPKDIGLHELARRLDDGTLNLYPANRLVGDIALKVRSITGAGNTPRVAPVPVQFGSPDTGIVQMTVYQVLDAQGHPHYVDAALRVYPSKGDEAEAFGSGSVTEQAAKAFEAWRKENRLPPGLTIFPAEGRLVPPGQGKTVLRWSNTPAVPDTWKKTLLHRLDQATFAGAMFAGGAVIIGSGGLWALPLLGIATSYNTVRSGSAILDLVAHRESLSPRRNPAARNEMLNFASGLLAMGATGSTMVLRSGVPRLLGTTTGLQVGANASNLLVTTDGLAYAINNWRAMPPEDRATLAASMIVFGGGWWRGGGRSRSFGRGLIDPLSPSATYETLRRHTRPDLPGLRSKLPSSAAPEQPQPPREAATQPLARTGSGLEFLRDRASGKPIGVILPGQGGGLSVKPLTAHLARELLGLPANAQAEAVGTRIEIIIPGGESPDASARYAVTDASQIVLATVISGKAPAKPRYSATTWIQDNVFKGLDLHASIETGLKVPVAGESKLSTKLFANIDTLDALFRDAKEFVRGRQPSPDGVGVATRWRRAGDEAKTISGYEIRRSPVWTPPATRGNFGAGVASICAGICAGASSGGRSGARRANPSLSSFGVTRHRRTRPMGR